MLAALTVLFPLPHGEESGRLKKTAEQLKMISGHIEEADKKAKGKREEKMWMTGRGGERREEQDLCCRWELGS